MNEPIFELVPLSDYFNVKGTITTTPKELMAGSKTPRVTTSATNNGFDELYDNVATETGGVITIDSATNGFIAFQPYDFLATDHVEKIERKDGVPFNEKTGLYVVTALRKATKNKFQYGFKFSQSRIKIEKLVLPLISNTKEIDWKYIEKFMEKILLDVQKENILQTQNELKKSLNLSDREWNLFEIKDIASVVSGADLPKTERFSGSFPFIGASSKKNGITDYIEKIEGQPKKFAENVIGVNRNGSVGWTFYHPYEAYFSGDTRYLTLKDQELSPEIGMFLRTSIMNQKEQFGYGFKLGTDRLRELKINLPIIPNKTKNKPRPDWKFMHDYISSLPNGDLL